MSPSRRDFLTSVALAGAAAGAAPAAATLERDHPAPAAEGPADQRSRGGVHRTLEQDHPDVFIDACMQMWPDADFANAHRHGVTAYAVTAWDPHASLDHALEGLMAWHLVARQYPNLEVVRTADDIRRAKRDRKAGLLLAAQDGDWIGFGLHRVEAFQRLGLRMMLLAYNRGNHLCEGCLDRTGSGLTRYGELVVAECNRVGIVLDCSHTGKRSTLDIMDRSRHPCVFSHSNPSALVPNPRNIDDEQIKACAARGGVVALVTWGPLVMKPGQRSRPTVDDFIAIVDYVAQLTGSTDHIAIGTDMSIGTYPDHAVDPWGEPVYPSVSGDYDRAVTADIRSPLRNIEGFSDYSEVVPFANRLQAHGYAPDDVRKILGGNLLRVFDRVWGPGATAA